MAHFLKYQPQSGFVDGIFIPYATQEEAERQFANDMLFSARDDFDGIVEADYPSGLPAPKGVLIGDEFALDPEHPLVKADWLKNHTVVADADAVLAKVEEHQEAILQERITAHAKRDEEVHRVTVAISNKGYDGLTKAEREKAIAFGMIPMAVSPGNAYAVCSGGTATAGAIALGAATAKTVVGVAAGSNNAPCLVEAAISFDGVTASAVPVLIEHVSGTNATNPPGTASTSMTPKQIRGVTAPSVQTAAYAWSTEPTVLEVFKKRLLTPNGGLIVIQYPLGREPTGEVTSSTQFKFMGIRLTAPAAVNCHVDIEFEE